MVIVMSALRIGVIRMKNKEKFATEILEIACDGNRIAIIRQTGEFRSCHETSCRECLFHSDTERCKEKAREWAESEYIEKPVISKRDRVFLEYLREKYKYIARDENGKLIVYETQPRKGESYWIWICDSHLCLERHFNIDFPMVKWSDSEPWLIEDLKKLEVVDSYE